MAYCNTKTYPLRYSDFDFKDELNLSALLALVQESACLSANELGFGYDDLRPKNFGFITVNTYCKLLRPIRLGESVTVETWPLPPRMLFFERHYRVKSGEETVALLASRWCLVDLNTFTMLRPEALKETHENCPYRAERVIDVPNWHIPHADGEEAYRMRVNVSHCDHYLHANNTRYLDFFIDAFSMDELAKKQITAFQITYSKQAKPGRELVVLRKDFEGYSLLEALADEYRIAQCRLEFEDRHD